MADAYQIGVAIALNSNGLSVLSALAGGLKSLDTAASAATGKMNALKVAALGAMGVVAGAGIFRGLEHLVRKGDELVHQQSLLRRQGLDNVAVAEATARAWETVRQVQGTRVEDNLRMFGELRSQVSSDAQALALLPDLARMGVLIQNETGRAPDKMAQTMMRVLEMRGQIFGPDGHTIDMEKVRKELAMAYQAMSASHGLITPQTLLNFQQQAGPAGMAMSPDAYYRTMPTAMQTMGGNRAGTAVASLFAQFMGGVMTQRTVAELQKLHLIDPDKVHVGRGGHVTVDAGAIQGFDPSNPFAFFNGPFRQAVAAHGGGRTPGQVLEGVLDPAMVQEMYRALGRETTRRLVAEFIQLAPTFERDFGLRQRTMTPEAAEKEADHDPTMAMARFQAAWSNLQTALGAPLVEASVSLLGRMTAVLNDLGQWAAAHPQMVEQIGMVAAAFAGLLGVGGVLAIGGAALSALGVLAGPVGLIGLAAGISAVALAMDRFHGQPAPAGPNGMRSEAADNAPRPRANQEVSPPQQTWAERIGEMLPTARQVADGFKVFVPRVLFALSDSVLAVGDAIGHSARRLFDVLRDDAMLGLRSLASTLSDKLGEVSRAILDWIGGLPAAVAGAIGHALTPHVDPADPVLGAQRRRGAPNPGPDGQPYYRPQSYVPPPAGAAPRPQPVAFNLDGRKVAEGLIPHMGRLLDRAPSGQVAFDPSMSPRYGGAAMAT